MRVEHGLRQTCGPVPPAGLPPGMPCNDCSKAKSTSMLILFGLLVCSPWPASDAAESPIMKVFKCCARRLAEACT